MFDANLKNTLDQIKARNGNVCFLTGAGVSAESGIRTFRGKDGYWTVGSDVYTPQEMATARMFYRAPEECWKWYLMRFLVCRDAEPNAGHKAIANSEITLGERFSLITQNIDGLHLQAGSSQEKCYQIHGSINHMRCSKGCCPDLFSLPTECKIINETEDFASVRDLLICPECGAMSRPHVLWFDEYYTEEHYQSESAMTAAQNCDLLIVAGTTLLTSLPAAIMDLCYTAGVPIINIDIESGRASQMAENSHRGAFIQAPSASVLPELCQLL